MKHRCSIWRDDQRGGYVWRCECGEQAKRPTYYRIRALRASQRHVEEVKRWGALPMGERP